MGFYSTIIENGKFWKDLQCDQMTNGCHAINHLASTCGTLKKRLILKVSTSLKKDSGTCIFLCISQNFFRATFLQSTFGQQLLLNVCIMDFDRVFTRRSFNGAGNKTWKSDAPAAKIKISDTLELTNWF